MKKFFLIFFVMSFSVILLTPRTARAGYFWSGGISYWVDSTWSDVNMFWSHHDMEDISKWKFCWRRKSNTNKGKNPCDYNSKIVFDPEATVRVKWDVVFKYQVEGYNTRKKKWKTYSLTISRPCFNARWSNSTISTLCNP